jgi:hypothetical protein
LNASSLFQIHHIYFKYIIIPSFSHVLTASAAGMIVFTLVWWARLIARQIKKVEQQCSLFHLDARAQTQFAG